MTEEEVAGFEDEVDDVWGDGDASEDDQVGEEQVGRAQEMDVLKDKFERIGFEQGMGETYDQEGPEAEVAFDEGFVEGFTKALQAGEMLGTLRLLASPDADHVERFYKAVNEGDATQIATLKDSFSH